MDDSYPEFRRATETGHKAALARRTPAQAVGCVLLLCAVLAGCSIARLAYNNFDWLLLRELDTYTDLTPAQEARAATLLRQRLEAHRRSELPDYARYLRRVRRMAENGILADEADWIVDQAYALALRTVKNIIPAIAPSLAELSSRQIAHLESHLAKVNRDYRDEYLPASPKIRAARRVRRTVRRIEHWIGDLRDDQMALVRRLRVDFPESAEEWLAYNIDQQHALLSLLRTGAGSGAVESFLRRWWTEPKERPANLENKSLEIIERIKSMIVSVDATLDQEQRRFLLWRLDGYLEQVDALTGQDP